MCESHTKKLQKQNNENQIIDHLIYENSLDYTGVYKVTTPCADGESIELKIWLNNDNTFSKSFFYIGKSPEIFTENGTL